VNGVRFLSVSFLSFDIQPTEATRRVSGIFVRRAIRRGLSCRVAASRDYDRRRFVITKRFHFGASSTSSSAISPRRNGSITIHYPLDRYSHARSPRADRPFPRRGDSIGEERRERRRAAWWLARSLAIFSVEGFKRVSGHPRIDRRINPADRYKALWVE